MTRKEKLKELNRIREENFSWYRKAIKSWLVDEVFEISRKHIALNEEIFDLIMSTRKYDMSNRKARS
jgi:hypothetical protein